MSEHKCKGCLIDSTHGKLQKKKDALLEFIFSHNSLCLTVSAQNVNIISYTLSKETVASVVTGNDMLVINLKVKKQVKISAIGKNKITELKFMLDALLHDDYSAYETSMENFCNNSTSTTLSRSNNTSKTNQSINSMTESPVLSEKISKKTFKTDKMKNDFDFCENDENSQPPDKPKHDFHSASNFYPQSQNGHRLSTDEPVSQIHRKRTIDTPSAIRFEHATNSTSPYFVHKPTTFKRNLSIGESRNSPLINIHSKPLNHTKLWDDENSFNDSLYPTKRYDIRSTPTTTNNEIFLSQAMTSTMNLRKKGLKNIGSTCYMNSILQCLLNIDPFRYDLMVTNSELITSSLLDEDTIYLCVLQILALLQDRQLTQTNSSTTTQLTDEERTVESQALINLKKAVEKHSGNFFGSRQQDSHEFLNLVVSIITDEIEAIKVKLIDQSSSCFTRQIVDPTTNNFQFCLITERRCDTCSFSTTSKEIHTALLIHVTDEETKTAHNNSLSDLLTNYFASESMDGCFCETCESNQLKHIQYNLERLPRVFVFYLKRWHVTKNATGELESVSKEDHPIDCPLSIDILPFCSSNTLQPSMIDSIEDLPNLKDLLKQRENLSIIEPKRARLSTDTDIYDITENIVATHGEYRLFAVINHHGGSSDVGHYTSTVYDAKGDTWWTYDDTSVTSCTEHRVLKYLAPDAYGVMYMHKDVLKVFQPVINNSFNQ